MLIVATFARVAPAQDLAYETKATPKHEFFSDVWLSAYLGLSGRLAADLATYQAVFAGSLAVDISVFRAKYHHIVFTAGYQSDFQDTSKGTTAFKVETMYRRPYTAVGYDFLWKYLAVGAKLGFAAHIITSHAAYYDVDTEKGPGGHVVGYTTNEKLDEYENTGFEPGFLAAMHVGFDLGRAFHWGEDVFRLGVNLELAPRGERYDFHLLFGATLGFKGLVAKK